MNIERWEVISLMTGKEGKGGGGHVPENQFFVLSIGERGLKEPVHRPQKERRKGKLPEFHRMYGRAGVFQERGGKEVVRRLFPHREPKSLLILFTSNEEGEGGG